MIQLAKIVVVAVAEVSAAVESAAVVVDVEELAVADSLRAA